MRIETKEGVSAPNAPQEEVTAPTAPREIPNVLSAAQIATILPHRYPFALVDRVLDYQAGEWAIGRKCVTMNEPFFCGHFPGNPIMPGVLIVEALAQVGAIGVLTKPEYTGKLVLFGGIKNARFRQQVIPGDVLDLLCSITAWHGLIGTGKAVATVDGKVAVSAVLTFVVTDAQ
ncbi:MAG: 3-hydroxyacyl-ACP dehydratase FabZ [Faecalibacterium sp.]